MASVTRTVSPTGTLPARGVMAIVLPEISLPLVPRLWIRHTLVPEMYVSAGQLALDPVQFSARSQNAPDEARQTLVADRNASVGQVVLVPVQLSATSQIPAEALQTAPA